MKFLIFLFFFLSTTTLWAQYTPRGYHINDNYLPNLAEPDKWILSLDGMIDYQKENQAVGSSQYQVTHFNFNGFYGGQIFRGGVQVIQDRRFDTKDLSIGVGFAYNRPFFLEGGVGYLQRFLPASTYDGLSYNLKLGYTVNWIMHVKYRVRFRGAMVFNAKELNVPGGKIHVQHLYPLVGIEFET